MRLTKRFFALGMAILLFISLTACVPKTQLTNTPPATTAPKLHVCPTTDPYQGMTKETFYENYSPACCYQDAQFRSDHGFLSGSLEVPGQYAQDAAYRPTQEGKFVRNTDCYYLDGGNTYVVVDGYGAEVMRIYRGGGYITLEEVAAYMYAFGGADGSFPANYTSKKKTTPSQSIWGEYLRVNHSRFIGNTSKYPYEPELPDISGCGGELSYYEMDIGTTGTSTPGYAPKPYVKNGSITRGAARLVYARQDLNGNGTADIHFNPNGSLYAIEGITSPDGRVLGKMGHSERIGKGLYKNVPGEYDIQLFKAAVKYFK